MLRNGSWHALVRRYFTFFALLLHLSSLGRAPKGKPSLEKLPRSCIQSGDTWTFKSVTPPGEPPECYRGGLLDLAMSSKTGELLDFQIFQLDFAEIFFHKRYFISYLILLHFFPYYICYFYTKAIVFKIVKIKSCM